jgi:hypothetical protein
MKNTIMAMAAAGIKDTRPAARRHLLTGDPNPVLVMGALPRGKSRDLEHPGMDLDK